MPLTPSRMGKPIPLAHSYGWYHCGFALLFLTHAESVSAGALDADAVRSSLRSELCIEYASEDDDCVFTVDAERTFAVDDNGLVLLQRAATQLKSTHTADHPAEIASPEWRPIAASNATALQQQPSAAAPGGVRVVQTTRDVIWEMVIPGVVFTLTLFCCGAFWWKQKETRSPSATSGGQLREAMPLGTSKSTAIIGEISFNAGCTQYCIIPHTAPPEELLSCVIRPLWGLRPPLLRLSLFGSEPDMLSTSFDLDEFSHNLVELATRTDAWMMESPQAQEGGVITQLSQVLKSEQVPCISVRSFGALAPLWQEALLLADNYKATMEPPEEPRFKLRPHQTLNHTCSHCILCDDGRTGEEAQGIKYFRDFFDDALSDAREPLAPGQPMVRAPSPKIAILIGGGGESLHHVDSFLQDGGLLMVCQGSGGAADAIASASRGRTGQTPQGLDLQLLRDVVDSGRVEICPESSSLLEVIFGCVFRQASPVMRLLDSKEAAKEQLDLAMRWRSADNYEILAARWLQAGGDPFEMCNLFFHGMVECQAFKESSERPDRSDLAPLITWLLRNCRGHVEQFCASLGPVPWSSEAGVMGERTSLEGLLLWLVDKEAPMEMILAVWEQMEDPVHAALAAASASRYKSKFMYPGYRYDEVLDKKRIKEQGEDFEKLAVCLLEDLTRTTGKRPIEYLFHESQRWNNMSVWDLTEKLECKAFIGADFFRAAVDSYFVTPRPFAVDKQQLGSRYINGLNLIFLPCSSDWCGLTSWEVLSVPCVKFNLDFFSRIIWFVLYTAAVFSGRLATLTAMVLTIFVWAVAMAIEEMIKCLNKPSKLKYFRDPWNVMTFIHIAIALGLLIVAWILPAEDASQYRVGLETVHAVNLLPAALRVLQACVFMEFFGKLFCTLYAVIRDLASIFVIMACVCFAFGVVLEPILYLHHFGAVVNGEEKARNRDGMMLTWPFWSIFGLDQTAVMHATQLESGWTRGLALTLVFLLALLANVVLVNLYTAVMTNTYERLQRSARIRWLSIRLQTVLEFNKGSDLPVPLNLVLGLFDICRWVARRNEPPQNLSSKRATRQAKLCSALEVRASARRALASCLKKQQDKKVSEATFGGSTMEQQEGGFLKSKKEAKDDEQGFGYFSSNSPGNSLGLLNSLKRANSSVTFLKDFHGAASQESFVANSQCSQ